MNIENFTRIDHLIPSIQGYVEHRIPTGSFLRACLEKDLKEAVGRADRVNIELLPVIICYLYNEVPSTCWGSRERVKSWLANPDIASHK